MAGLALALRFVPYSDDHGNFDPLWTAVMVVCAIAALAASVYLVITLEILKLRTKRLRELFGTGVSAPEEAVVDEGVAVELETGSFPAVDPETGEFAAVEPQRRTRPRSGCHKLVTSATPRPARLGYSRRPPS